MKIIKLSTKKEIDIFAGQRYAKPCLKPLGNLHSVTLGGSTDPSIDQKPGNPPPPQWP
jgi:hypothetical protein